MRKDTHGHQKRKFTFKVAGAPSIMVIEPIIDMNKCGDGCIVFFEMEITDESGSFTQKHFPTPNIEKSVRSKVDQILTKAFDVTIECESKVIFTQFEMECLRCHDQFKTSVITLTGTANVFGLDVEKWDFETTVDKLVHDVLNETKTKS